MATRGMTTSLERKEMLVIKPVPRAFIARAARLIAEKDSAD